MIKYVLVSLQSKNAFRVDFENRHVFFYTKRFCKILDSWN